MSPAAERLRITEANGVLGLEGQLDAHTAPQLSEHLAPLPGDAVDLPLDVSAVDFIDSSGLRVLIEANQRALDDARRLVLRNPSPAVQRLLEISGLVGHLATEQT